MSSAEAGPHSSIVRSGEASVLGAPLRWLKVAVDDIREGLRKAPLWMALASEEIADSHRRTVLGPLWQFLNYLVYVGTIALFIGPENSKDFTLYVALGLLVWLYIQEIVSLSASLFLREESYINGTVLPLSVYVMKLTALTATRSAYALAGAVLIAFYIGITPTKALITVVPAVLLLLVGAPGVITVFAFIGVFYRDFQFIVGHVMRLLLFVTPIFWVHGGGGGLRGFLYHWNPFTHYLNIVRTPIIEGTVPTVSWIVTLSLTTLISICAVFLLGAFKRRIVFLL